MAGNIYNIIYGKNKKIYNDINVFIKDIIMQLTDLCSSA